MKWFVVERLKPLESQKAYLVKSPSAVLEGKDITVSLQPIRKQDKPVRKHGGYVDRGEEQHSLYDCSSKTYSNNYLLTGKLRLVLFPLR